MTQAMTARGALRPAPFAALVVHQIGDNGVPCTANARSGVRTCHTFDGDGDGCRCWHDRPGRHWPAHRR